MSTPETQRLLHAVQTHIDDATPMGVNLVEGGATFRTWAPGAIDVYVITSDLPASRHAGWVPRESDRLLRRDDRERDRLQIRDRDLVRDRDHRHLRRGRPEHYSAA